MEENGKKGNLTELQKKAIEIAQRYQGLKLKEKIRIIAQAFGCADGIIKTSPCTGKWRGTSDMSILFDNGVSLFMGNCLTPKAKTVKVQTECVNSALVQFNPEIIQATKEAALPVLLRREARDNEIAVQKGLKPYILLNVEFNDGADGKTGGCLGWYYVTLAVDGKICTHLETGLYYDIVDGKVRETHTRADYFTAGALKEADVDYVFNNVGFSTESTLYTVPLRDDVRERAEKRLSERRASQKAQGITFPVCQCKDRLGAACYCDSFGSSRVSETLQEQQTEFTPDSMETGETVQTPRGTFHVTDMSRKQMEAAGYGLHHESEDGKYLIMANGTRAFAIRVQDYTGRKADE